MAKARLYAYNGVAPKTEVKGQAAVILDVLKRQNGELKLAATLAEQVTLEGNLKTRQDVLRVTLYYIIVFKGLGLISTQDQEVTPVGVTVVAEQPTSDADHFANLDGE